jgi:hypothetical protein
MKIWTPQGAAEGFDTPIIGKTTRNSLSARCSPQAVFPGKLNLPLFSVSLS